MSLGVVCERLIDVETADRLVLPGASFDPAGDRNTCVVWIHGFGVGYDYRPCVELGRLLAAAGTGFLAAGTRGHYGGATLWRRREQHWGTRRAGSWWEDMREASLDIDAWLSLAHAAGYRRVILAGHSHGGIKVAWHLGTAAQFPDIAGLILASPSLGLTRLDPAIIALAREYLDREAGGELLPEGSWPTGFGTRTVSALTMASWADVANVVFKAPSTWQNRVTVPVLAFYGETGDVGADGELERFTSEMTNAPSVETQILAGVQLHRRRRSDRGGHRRMVETRLRTERWHE